MRRIFYLIVFLLFMQPAIAQNINGKWYGKITQQPGAYSMLYDLELNLDQKKKKLSGESYATITDSLYIKIGLKGNVTEDQITLSEHASQVRQEILPHGWYLCIKNFQLAYRKTGETEYLEGSWDGKGRDGMDCIPGKVFLARTKEELNKYMAENKDSTIQTQQQLPELLHTAIDFTSPFLNTTAIKVTEIDVKNTELQLKLTDYWKVDNDTVSVYLNRNALAQHVLISKRATIIKFKIDTRLSLHEILLYAENLGQIPPNTSELLVIDGDRSHRVIIESDKQKTAAVYLRYKP